MILNIDTADLLKFTNKIETMPEKLGRAAVEALNETGAATQREIIIKLSEDTGFNNNFVAQFVSVKQATLNDKTYEIKINGDLFEDDTTPRRFETRSFDQRDKGMFDEGILVNVTTAADPCPICEAIAEDGPYTMDEINKLKLAHAHFLRVELNCRCQLAPAQFKRRLPVRTRRGRTGVIDTRMTLKQLADKVIEKSRIVMRAK